MSVAWKIAVGSLWSVSVCFYRCVSGAWEIASDAILVEAEDDTVIPSYAGVCRHRQQYIRLVSRIRYKRLCNCIININIG